MQDRLQIWGAGMAWLIAANVLRKHNPIVYEAKSELPHNHKALLRFRTDKVSIATGIPFKKVSIRKAIWHDGKLYNESNLKFDNLYSQKVTGTVAKRSIENFHGEVRYIAPHDFVERLAEGVLYGDYVKTRSQELKNFALLLLFFDIKRKYVRFENMAKMIASGEKVSHDEIIDTLSDLAVYGVMGLMLMDYFEGEEND